MLKLKKKMRKLIKIKGKSAKKREKTHGSVLLINVEI